MTRIANALEHIKGVVLDTDDLMGLGTLDDRMLILVDIDKLMSRADMGLIENLSFEPRQSVMN